MRGIILAGGNGTRMLPCTKVTNKHLLPVYDKPMIYYPLYTLINAGIKDILIVSGPGHAGHFLNLLGSGNEFGVRISYEIQDKAGGIGEALGLAKSFAGKDKVTVVLGDNIIEDNITDYVKEFEKQKDGARIFLKESSLEDAKRSGIAVVEDSKITYMEEKPKEPKSNLVMIGLYMFDANIFDYIKTLKPSGRGEIDVVDAIQEYLKRDKLCHNVLKGFWSDAGTFDSLLRASLLVKSKGDKH